MTIHDAIDLGARPLLTSFSSFQKFADDFEASLRVFNLGPVHAMLQDVQLSA
jgi:hypothetical protein